MLLSIVVCTHNRANLLRACLASLTSIDDDRCEVIVVDNNSSDETNLVCQNYRGARSIRYVFEPRQGLSIARNTGLQVAAGEYVAFIDDDAIASPDYATRAIATIESYSFDCFGGACTPSFSPGRPKWYDERYETPLLRQSAGLLPESAFAYGGNLVVRKAIAKKVGGFPEALGMRGTRIGYGEENLLQVRIRQSGGTVGFDPELRVDHCVDRRKYAMTWQIASAFASGRDSWLAFDRTVRWHHLAYAGFMLLAQPLFRLIRGLIWLPLPNYYLGNVVVDVGSAAAQRLGQLAGALPLLVRPLRGANTSRPRGEPRNGP